MNNKSKLGIIGFLLINSYSAVADLESGANRLHQPAQFNLTFNTLADAEFDKKNIDDIDFSVDEVKLNGVFSTFNAGAGLFIIGGEFRYSEYQFDSARTDDNQLYEVAVPMTYITGSSDWQHIIRISPGINSDFEDLNGDDFTLTGIYQAKYTSSPHTNHES